MFGRGLDTPQRVTLLSNTDVDRSKKVNFGDGKRKSMNYSFNRL